MNGEDRADANRHLRLSANEYMNALDFFPHDDEFYSRAYHLISWRCSLHLLHHGAFQLKR